MPLSKRSKLSVVLSLFALLAIIGGLLITGVVQRGSAHASGGNQVVRNINSSGTTSIVPNTPGKKAFQLPEINSVSNGLGHAQNQNQGVNRSRASHPLSAGPVVQGTSTLGSGTELLKSFNGINHIEQRLTNGGNQFSLEPPDQGLCVGNGFILETVNDALAVYNTSGKTLKAVTALNSFYHYPPSIIRPSGPFGPFITDPSCYFDKATQRWFHIVLTIDVNPKTGAFLGPNHLDIAVSQTSSPLGKFTIYRIPVQDDGTQGTPNHKCDGLGGPGTTGPCLGDYPHLGADANGFYITTNEYGFFAPPADLGFHAAQIYAFSKLALAANASTISFVQLDTIGLVGSAGAGLPGNPGFTVWPASSPDTQFATFLNGTEFFMSSDAAPEANVNLTSGASRDLIVWTLSNTASLNTTSPVLLLSNKVLTVNPYSIPPKALQKKGSTPLITCLNTPSCAAFLIGGADPFTEVESPLDANDTRMQQVTYANGQLWGALDTNLTVNHVNEAGIEWFVVNPVALKVINQGYLGGNNANLTYPAIGVTTSGKGVMAFTLVGPNNFPSAAYASIDAQNGTGPIHLAQAGLGPWDGFTATKIFSPNANAMPRPRWGDYGAAVPIGNTVWIASEYIGQTCTYRQYITNTPASPLFTCNLTRTALANWYTRISQVEVNT
jgi:hypothetical protein